MSEKFSSFDTYAAKEEADFLESKGFVDGAAFLKDACDEIEKLREMVNTLKVKQEMNNESI